MSDYRHDIYGPNGLSQRSGLYTVESSALALVNDNEVKADVLKGKNLLHNGMPNDTFPDWDGTDENSPKGWTRTLSTSKGENILFSTLAGGYFHVQYDAKVSSSKPGLAQFVKEYKRNGQVYLNGEAGGEIKDILGGRNVTLSLEVKANQPVYVYKAFTVTYNDGTPNLTVLDPPTSVANPPVVLPEDGWKNLSTTAKMPDDWQSLIEASNVKNVTLYIMIYLRDNVTEPITGVEYWLRNVKLEYGTEATEYTYSDWDKDYLIENPIIDDVALNAVKRIVEQSEGALILPDGVTTIGEGAFGNMTWVTSIVIPNSVTHIGNYAFYSDSLRSLTFRGNSVVQIESDSLNGVPSDCDIYVPANLVDSYKAAQYWSSRASYIQAIPEV